MNNLQFFILVAIPVVGILANSRTMNFRFARLESKMESRFDRLDARFDKLMGNLKEIDSPA